MRMAGWLLVSSAGRLRGFYDLSAQPGMGGIVLEALVPDHGRRQRRHGQGQVHDVQRQRGRQPPRQSHEPRHQSRHEQQRLVVMCGEGVAAPRPWPYRRTSAGRWRGPIPAGGRPGQSAVGPGAMAGRIFGEFLLIRLIYSMILNNAPEQAFKRGK